MDERAADSLPLRRLHQIDRVKLAIAAERFIALLSAACEAEEARRLFGDKDDRIDGGEVAAPVLRSRFNAERFETGLRDDAGVGRPPAFNVHASDRVRIVDCGRADPVFHGPHSTMRLLHGGFDMLDAWSFPL
jgi:hypothetical protein